MALPQSHAPLTSYSYPYDAAVQAFPHLVESGHTFPIHFTPNGVSNMPLGNPPQPVPPQWGSPRPQELTGLSETMSELAISDCAQPPPSKIRRRNALTIQVNSTSWKTIQS